MNDQDKSPQALIEELSALRRKVAAYEQEVLDRRQAEEALRESKLRFRALFESNIDGMMITITDGTIISANKRMEEMLGMSEAEIVKVGRAGIVVHDERLTAGLAERARTGRFQGELTMRRKDGSLLPVELSSSTFLDHDGIEKTGQVVRDITERKIMEQLLKQDREYLERRVEERTREIRKQAELLNLAHDAIIVRNESESITFWNIGAQEIYGWTKEEALGQPVHYLLQTVFPLPAPVIVDKVQRDGRWEGELFQTCRDGRKIVVLSRWALHRSAPGGMREIMEVNRDITVRKKAGEYNRILIEVSLDPLVTIGPDGRITDVNTATEAATGFSRNELVGTDFSGYFTNYEKASAGYKQVFQDGFVRDYELEIRHKSGHITPVFYNASVYKDAMGNIVGVFAAARDVTERKLAEKELSEKTKALEELNTALKVLIDHYKNDQREFEERIVSNIRMRIIPYLEKLARTRLEIGQAALVEILERSFRDIASPFLKAITSEHFRFSPKEIDIISLIKEGKTTKEIAQILNIGKRTVDSYRDNIRGKLGLASKKVNLRTYLLSLDKS